MELLIILLFIPALFALWGLIYAGLIGGMVGLATLGGIVVWLVDRAMYRLTGFILFPAPNGKQRPFFKLLNR